MARRLFAAGVTRGRIRVCSWYHPPRPIGLADMVRMVGARLAGEEPEVTHGLCSVCALRLAGEIDETRPGDRKRRDGPERSRGQSPTSPRASKVSGRPS